MAGKIFGPRKQRTRGHVIADLGVHHVEGFILRDGHTPCRLTPDYGYDLVLFTHDQQGYLEPGAVYIQVKASEAFQTAGGDFVFDLDLRDYNLWMLEEMPVILMLYDASRKRACWIWVQAYFSAGRPRQPKQGAKQLRVRVPTRQLVNRRTVARWRDLKGLTLRRPAGGDS